MLFDWIHALPMGYEKVLLILAVIIIIIAPIAVVILDIAEKRALADDDIDSIIHLALVKLAIELLDVAVICLASIYAFFTH